jgi:anthraniloyl-CoA monooxygenase
MKIVCVGGGPAGLYFAISAKLRDAGHDITVIERDPPGTTYGWGVVYWDNLLDMLYGNDAESARQLRAASMLWQEQEIRLPHAPTAYLPGYGYSLGRAAMLDILESRAADLGVDIQRQREVNDLAAVDEAELVVVSDGANSRIRTQFADCFGTTMDVGGNPYIWLGTNKVFDTFVFAFEQTSVGWIWFHAYPSGREVSTCIVECTPETWQALGFGELSSDDSVRLLEKIFASALDGCSLMSRARGETARWSQFAEVSNRSWRHNNMALVGDAAHTTHFTLGSGTRLAMIDATVLAHSLYEHAELADALRAYDERGRQALRPVQAAARTSMAWFQRVDRYVDRGAVDFAYSMAARSGAQPPWRYQMHLANQNPLVRRTQRAVYTGLRRYSARRRGEPATTLR